MIKNSTNSTTISVISGKGGTGKSLLTAVLGRAISRQSCKVILVDFDIFVRGLTILLTNFSTGYRAKGKLAISDFLGTESDRKTDKVSTEVKLDDLQIFRFFECDVLPATSDIGEALDYDQKLLASHNFGQRIFKRIVSLLQDNYDFIIFDCRAGIDSLVLSTCKNCDVVISVAEDDDVCIQANTNLINHLRYVDKVKNVYTIINKGRRIKTYKDLKESPLLRTDYNYLGVVPFDEEIMQDFGKPRLWKVVDETLYFVAIIEAWNKLAKKIGLQEISTREYNFPPKIFMSKKFGKYTLIERMLLFYSVLMMIFGLGYSFFEIYTKASPRKEVLLVALFSILMGGIGILFSISGLRRFLLGKTDRISE